MDESNLSDSITLVVADDNNVLCFVNLKELNVVTLPTIKVRKHRDWKDVVEKELLELMGTQTYLTLVTHKVTRVWIPIGNSDTYITNIVMWIKVSAGFMNFFLVPTQGTYAKLKWLNIRDLSRFYNLYMVGSPIFFEIFPKLKAELFGRYTLTYPSAIQELGSYAELNNYAFKKNTGVACIDEMIEESSIATSRRVVYIHFLQLVFPDIVMSGGNFMNVVTQMGFNRLEGAHLFRAADVTSRGFLTFNEYFGICCALEPDAKHSGNCGKARATYIFRYMNVTGTGKLTITELRELAILVRKSRLLPVDAANLEKELREIATILNVGPDKAIDGAEFVKYAEDLRIRGISNILRSSKSILIVIANANASRLSKPETKVISNLTSKTISIERSVKNTTKWEVATHSLRISNSGTEITVKSIFNTDNFKKEDLDRANITLENRRPSLDSFSKKNICNEVVDMTKELANINSIKSGNQGLKLREYVWSPMSSVVFAQKLMQVCQLAIEVLIKEPRLLKISTPSIVLGDFHGNFGDLLCFEEMLWPLSPRYNPSSILFLGDYVDRGFYGIEIVAYLFANKILHPTKFFLLRGNHEVREVQQMFTFLSECIIKFGEQQGRIVWETVNTVFDHMPIAAVIDGKLFCCHGGIPPPWLCPSVEAINRIPKPLAHPDLKSPLAWEILWNDPIKSSDITREIQIELAANFGFAQNPKRGTAHVFNCAATSSFLKNNNFSHIIRAHELAMTGFSIFHRGKLISLFSTSKYNENNNESACLFIDNYVIQIIRLSPGH
ncbi:uncharacterized protein [Atheta coriaria]|uniref:uncharacterized protein isoform X2 n=1 Tax=Dalotia coriaria TaxID=877792 RepID=UPI0031F43339